MTYTVATDPTRARSALDRDGTYTYTPTSGARLAASAGTGPVSDTFTVTASNGLAATTESVSVPIANGVPSVVASIGVGGDPAGVALSPDGRVAYVTNESGHTVSVIDTATNTITGTINVSPQSSGGRGHP